MCAHDWIERCKGVSFVQCLCEVYSYYYYLSIVIIQMHISNYAPEVLCFRINYAVRLSFSLHKVTLVPRWFAILMKRARNARISFIIKIPFFEHFCSKNTSNCHSLFLVFSIIYTYIKKWILSRIFRKSLIILQFLLQKCSKTVIL